MVRILQIFTSSHDRRSGVCFGDLDLGSCIKGRTPQKMIGSESNRFEYLCDTGR